MRYAITTVVLIAVTAAATVYGAFHADMERARQQIAAGSSVLSTPFGEIEYALRGEGPPVLLLHGAGGGYDQGLLLGRIALSGGYRQIAVSRFGYLRSPVPADASNAAQAAEYATLLDHLLVDRVTVVAGSGGGPSALQFAHDFPERTSALVLVSAVTRLMPPGEQDASQLAVIHAVQRSDFLFWLAAQAFQSQFLGLLGVPPDVYARLSPEEQALSREMLDVMHPMSLRLIGSFREGEQVPPEAAQLGQITVPTLILHAKDDSLVVPAHAEHAHRTIPHASLVLYETGGHGLLAQVSNVREQIRDFVSGVSAGQ